MASKSCSDQPEEELVQAVAIDNSPSNYQQPDYDFVDQPDQDYFCPVSLELLTQPHQTTCCGNHISQQAADRLIRDKKPCPMCKEDNLTTHVDKFFTRKVRQLKVYCPHKKSKCEWTGELGDLDQHTTSCPKRPWKCSYCKFQSTQDIGADHAPQCDYHPVPCSNHCEVGTVPRCHAEKHLLDCPLQLVDCEFASAGCDVRVPRRDLAGHMTESAQHHLMTATLLNLRLTRELSQKMEEKDQQIAELKEELEAKIDTNRQEQTQDLHAKLQQQTGYVETKLTQNMDAKLQQQTRDLNTKLQQQTRGLDTKLQQATRCLDTRLTQNMDAKLQQATRDLDTKLQQETRDLDTKLQQETRDLDTKLTRNMDDKIQFLNANLQQQMHFIDAKLQKQIHDLDTKLHQQKHGLDTKLQQATRGLDTKLQQQKQGLDTKQTKATRGLDTKLQQQTRTTLTPSTKKQARPQVHVAHTHDVDTWQTRTTKHTRHRQPQ